MASASFAGVECGFTISWLTELPGAVHARNTSYRLHDCSKVSNDCDSSCVARIIIDSPAAAAVTPLVLTFEGLSLLCNVGQSRHTLSLPEMFFAARGKVMEMKEHSRSRGLPAKLPEALL